MNVHFGLKGEYKFAAQRADGTIREETEWMPNLITNIGLDAMGYYPSEDMISACVVGTGNATPAFTDTQLAAQVMTATTKNFGTPTPVAPNYDKKQLMIFSFPPAGANVNLAEVGVLADWYGGGGGKVLYSRALIVDSGGQPTTFSVLKDEILIVQYRHTVYIKNTDTTSVVNINGSGTPTTIVMRRCNAAATAHRLPSPGWVGAHGASAGGVGSTLAAITDYPQLSQYNATGQTSVLPYTAGTHYRDVSFFFPITVAPSPIAAMYVSTSNNVYSWQMSFNPPIDKNSDRTCTVVVRLSWGRYAP